MDERVGYDDDNHDLDDDDEGNGGFELMKDLGEEKLMVSNSHYP